MFKKEVKKYIKHLYSKNGISIGFSDVVSREIQDNENNKINIGFIVYSCPKIYELLFASNLIVLVYKNFISRINLEKFDKENKKLLKNYIMNIDHELVKKMYFRHKLDSIKYKIKNKLLLDENNLLKQELLLHPESEFILNNIQDHFKSYIN